MKSLVYLVLLLVIFNLVRNFIKAVKAGQKQETPARKRLPDHKASAPPQKTRTIETETLPSQPPLDSTLESQLPAAPPTVPQSLSEWAANPQKLQDLWVVTAILGKPKALRRRR